MSGRVVTGQIATLACGTIVVTVRAGVGSTELISRLSDELDELMDDTIRRLADELRDMAAEMLAASEMTTADLEELKLEVATATRPPR